MINHAPESGPSKAAQRWNKRRQNVPTNSVFRIPGSADVLSGENSSPIAYPLR